MESESICMYRDEVMCRYRLKYSGSIGAFVHMETTFSGIGTIARMDKRISSSAINGWIPSIHIAGATRSRAEQRRGIDAFIDTSWTN